LANQNNGKTRTVFAAIIGRPNVGKSSLLNGLLKVKLAIVSPKPQTTRTRITGVLTEGETQMVFVDTPGLHAPRTALGERMVKAAQEGMFGVDVCVLVADASFDPGDIEKDVIQKFSAVGGKVILALNKIDLLKEKSELLARITEYTALFHFDAVVPMSCKTGKGLSELKAEILTWAKPSPHFFDDDTLTDQPERTVAAEMIREKQLLTLDKEVPHGIAVDIETFREREKENGQILDIDATIYCERESHKGIIIGKNGAGLKRSATAARLDLERFFGCSVNLRCWVKVKENWRNRQGTFGHFGLD